MGYFAWQIKNIEVYFHGTDNHESARRPTYKCTWKSTISTIRVDKTPLELNFSCYKITDESEPSIKPSILAKNIQKSQNDCEYVPQRNFFKQKPTKFKCNPSKIASSGIQMATEIVFQCPISHPSCQIELEKIGKIEFEENGNIGF